MIAKVFTHKQLVEVAYRWVIKNASCGCAFKELVTTQSEIPDVLGFGSWGHSVLVECKVSRGDFLSDKKKKSRHLPGAGMGKFRYYCCPTGLIKKEEIPEGWGLIYVSDKGKAKCVHAPYKGAVEMYNSGFKQNMLAEHSFMYSALRRLHLRNRISEIYISWPPEDTTEKLLLDIFKELSEEQKVKFQSRIDALI